MSRLADGEMVDLLVIGLGVTGAGVALDAASRGLSVAAIDAHDLAYGTSRWSSKLVHGGLRYLANFDVAVAYECAYERGILMTRTAPHLSRPIPVLLPLGPYVSRSLQRMHRAGIFGGDVLRRVAGTPAALLPHSRRVSTVEALRLAPGLRADGLRGGNLNFDGQLIDDARLVTAIARTAAGLGARVLTRCRATRLDRDGATVRDELTCSEFRLRARGVVNAAGVWADQLVEGVRLRPSRGSHIIVRAERLGGLAAELTVPVPGTRARVVFAIPQPSELVYIGLTDEPVQEWTDEIAAPDADIDFLLDVIGPAFAEPPTRADVVGSYAGLRPLLDDGHGSTADVSRRHAIVTSAEGVVTVVGGKLTTYRRMAEDAVSTVVRQRHLPAGPSRTKRLPLVGAPAAHGPYADRYGSEAPQLRALAAGDPKLAAEVAPGVTGAELVFGLRHEGALDISDLLDRRTRIGLVPADRATALPAAEAIFAEYFVGGTS